MKRGIENWIYNVFHGELPSKLQFNGWKPSLFFCFCSICSNPNWTPCSNPSVKKLLFNFLPRILHVDFGAFQRAIKYLGNFFRRRSLHSHWLHHTATKGQSRAWWTRTSEMSLPSLPDGSNWNSPWQLNKEGSTTLHHSLGGNSCIYPERALLNLQQFISSLASSQSTFWLHLLELEMQPPSLHWNWSAEHSVADKQGCKRWCLVTTSSESATWRQAGRTHRYRRLHRNCPRSRPARCTRSCALRSGRSHIACNPSYTHGWLRGNDPDSVYKRRREECGWNCFERGEKKKVPLTTVGLLLVRFILAVGHAITSQGVVDTVSISTLKLIDVVTCCVEGCETKTEKCT